jgi:hypothetical protein
MQYPSIPREENDLHELFQHCPVLSAVSWASSDVASPSSSYPPAKQLAFGP